MDVLFCQGFFSFHLCIECLHHETVLIFLADDLGIVFDEVDTLLEIGQFDLSKLLSQVGGSDVVFIGRLLV